ncbi:ankyrin repeat domain-containing protein [Burkholderia vietnamiensis]|uniref:Ankyrin n=1 Tax=Burkholderia vietnamiensis (strain G4 / LMG 22486) TaxID=269482 RepID=A4JFS3_BURVG|nr:Ankyrin [Burkholderia vietnamiensis G4]MCB4344882.1 ankyrin repeat domain-containing protein [Burkholderia vietnamiensis]
MSAPNLRDIASAASDADRANSPLFEDARIDLDAAPAALLEPDDVPPPLLVLDAAHTALLSAAYHGSTDRVVELLPNSNVTIRSAALLVAARMGHPDCVQALLPVSDVKARNREGLTALMWAAQEGRVHCVRTLLPVSDPKARNREGLTAVMLAAREGHFECVSVLLPASDATAQDSMGKRALHHALDRAQRSRLACGGLECADLLAADPSTTPHARRAALDRIGRNNEERASKMPKAFAAHERSVLDIVAQSATMRSAAPVATTISESLAVTTAATMAATPSTETCEPHERSVSLSTQEVSFASARRRGLRI